MAAARPIWSGTLSFGLLNVPVQLMSGERRNELHLTQALGGDPHDLEAGLGEGGVVPPLHPLLGIELGLAVTDEVKTQGHASILPCVHDAHSRPMRSRSSA
jgi:hypothetical protein